MSRRIKGFEDYDFQYVSDSIFANNLSEWCIHCYVPYGNNYLWLDTARVFEGKSSDIYADTVVEDHKELLDTAKKVCVLSSCKMPRDLITAKYKKVLNPWLADIVIVPNDSIRKAYYKHIAFFSEIMKTIFLVCTNTEDVLNKFVNAKKGTKFGDFLTISEDNWINLLYSSDKSSSVELWKAIFDSEFEFIGDAVPVSSSNEWIIDVIEGALPKDKIVFEKTALEYLGNNDNQPTVENLLNIREMLNSKDEATNSVGLKALSMLDYIHYPNSVQLILLKADSYYNQWKYCKASNSSSVKFMFKQLFKGTTRHYYAYSKDTITQKDYDLFIQLLKALTESDNKYARTLANMPFMYMDGSMSTHPRIDDAA